MSLLDKPIAKSNCSEHKMKDINLFIDCNCPIILMHFQRKCVFRFDFDESFHAKMARSRLVTCYALFVNNLLLITRLH